MNYSLLDNNTAPRFHKPNIKIKNFAEMGHPNGKHRFVYEIVRCIIDVYSFSIYCCLIVDVSVVARYSYLSI